MGPEESHEVGLLATVPVPPEGHLQISWGPGNQLFLAAMPNAGSFPAAPMPIATSTVCWGRPSQNERRITYETLPLFKELQIAMQQGTHLDGSPNAVLRFSEGISAVLASVDSGNESPTEVSQEKMLWDLIALLFTRPPTPQGTVSEGLAHWLLQNQLALSPMGHPTLRQQQNALADLSPVELAEDYWPFIARAAALGWVDSAVDALCNHSAMMRWSESPTAADDSVQAEMGVLEPVVLLLRRMPRYRPGSDSELATTGRQFSEFSQFQQYRATWQGQCRDFLGASAEWDAADNESPSTAAGLRVVVSVLAGIEGALVESTNGWLELTVAHLLHAHPGLRPRVELRPLVRRCRQLCEKAENGKAQLPDSGLDRSPVHALPEIMTAAAEGDVQSVIASLSGCGCSPWLLAHGPLLVSANPRAASALHAPLPALGGDQVEAYLLEYAATLAPHKTTCRSAAEYLAWCPTHGAAAFERLMATMPDESVLYLASQFELPHLAAGVRRRRVRDHMSNGRSAAAAVEAAAMGDVPLLEAALAPVLNAVAAVLQKGVLPKVQIVKDVQQLTWVLGSLEGNRMPLSPSASFLMAYHELAEALIALESDSSRAFEVKGRACAAAMEALRVCPKPLWLHLAAALTPLIDSSPPVFNLSDTELLLLKFQEMSGELQGVNETIAGLLSVSLPDTEIKQQQTALITTALSQNLARAFAS